MAGTITQLMRLSKIVLRATPSAELGMTLRQFQALSLLVTQESQLQNSLCQQMLLDANNTVLLLNELEGNGWVERRRDPADRRRHVVVITDAGREAFRHAERARDSVEDSVLAGLTPAEREQFGALLSKALAEVGADPAPAPRPRAKRPWAGPIDPESITAGATSDH